MLSKKQKNILQDIVRRLYLEKHKQNSDIWRDFIDSIRGEVEHVLKIDTKHRALHGWKKILVLISAFFIGIVLNNVGYSLWRSDESSESQATKACTCPSVNGNTGNILFVYPNNAQSMKDQESNFEVIFKEISSVLGQLKLANKQDTKKP